ncbi:MAG: hybrid sensor histidine kinase/response regulator [Thermodesulfovibrionales bacterium]|nr:hybrid sensor histidine kinase/response regulator [Thermodesulfovibrionales bacterium]
MEKDAKGKIEEEPSPFKSEDIKKLALLGQHMAAISHELNNPLCAILGYAEMLQSMELDPKAKKYIDNIYISAIRASKIIEGLLSFLRKKQTILVPLKIQEVIQKTIDLLEYQIKTHAILLELNLPQTKLVKGDFHKLQQIFFNLIMNSIQALETQRGEKIISIKTEDFEDKVRILISDNGPGINSSIIDIENIFMPFSTTKKNGTGLGLSIVRSLIKEHEGEITLLPKATGCSFLIDLPATLEEEDKSTQVEKSKLNISKRVLIVDDDELVISAIGGIVKLLGCTVTHTAKPSEGLEELKRNDFDIIFVDYKMPMINGIEFIEKASKFVDIEKFVIITGYIGIEEKALFKKYNIPILRKPVKLEELKEAIETKTINSK